MSKENVSDINLSKVFSNFFNSYSKSINKQESRHGSLFVKPFKRKGIENENYLRIMVNYIHRNPIHHGICDNISDYKWSSYNQIMTGDDDLVDTSTLINWFGDKKTFEEYVMQSIHDYKNLNIE